MSSNGAVIKDEDKDCSPMTELSNAESASAMDVEVIGTDAPESAKQENDEILPAHSQGRQLKTACADEDESPSCKKPKLDIVLVEDLKENISDDIPIDLSQGVKVVLETGNFSKKNGSDPTHRLAIVQRLQDELRNEETRLLLLKKLRNSQLTQQSRTVTPSNHVHPAPATGTAAPRAAAPVHIRHQITNGGSSHPAAYRSEPLRQSYSRQPNGIMNNASRSVQAPVPAAARHPTAPPPSSLPSNRTSSAMPLVVSRPPAVQVQQHAPREAVTRPAVPEPTLAQRQAAAKLAVRRQLETTLLQLPLPKCAPPEMNFIPGIGSNAEFVVLLGLEEAVNCILECKTKVDHEESKSDSTNKDLKDMVKPFQCVRCQTDFTTIWKQDKDSPNAIVCERCAVSARKLALKHEHTNRLKAAFLQALQQERELEATGYAAIPSSVSVPSSSSGSFRPRTDANQISYDWKQRYSAADARVPPSAHSSSHNQSAFNRQPLDMRSHPPVGAVRDYVRRN